MNTPTRIKGGKKSFIAAIKKAYYGIGAQMHSPCVRYSHASGFFVESKLTPANSEVIWQEQMMYFANNGKPTIKSSDYAGIRQAILNS